jgi:hypothetical protein
MRQILAEMSVISEQHARSYDGISVHGGEKDRAPKPLSEKPMVDYWRDRYNGAHREDSKRAVIQEAVEALQRAKLQPIVLGQPPKRGEPLWKRYIAETDEDIGQLAREFNVTRRYILMIRQQYGRSN